MAKKHYRVIDRDLGYTRIMRQVNALKNKPHVTVGYHDDEQPYKDGTTVAEVAKYHEFGVPGKLPQRSTLRAGVDEKRPQIQAATRKLFKRMILGHISLNFALNKLGLLVTNIVKRKITTLDDPPLAESTKRRKANKLKGKAKAKALAGGGRLGLGVGNGSGNPLIDSGQMRASVNWKVKE